MSIRYRQHTTGGGGNNNGTERQPHVMARRDRTVPPLGTEDGRLLVALEGSSGVAGTALVTGIALIVALASASAMGRGQVDVTSFLDSNPTLGTAVGRGRALESPGSFTITGSLQSVLAYGRASAPETGFSITSALGTVASSGRGYVYQGGGFDVGFTSGFPAGLSSIAELGVMVGYGKATTQATGLSQTSALGTAGAVGGSGNSGRGIVDGISLQPTLAGTATGFDTGFSVGYGSVGFVPAATAVGRALADAVGLEQFGFLGVVSGIGLGELTFLPPYFARLSMGPVLVGDVTIEPMLDADVVTEPVYDAAVLVEAGG